MKSSESQAEVSGMHNQLYPNQSWLNTPDIRNHVNTPALVVDLDLLETNIRAMQQLANKHGAALRPHAKAHKCADIAKLQVEAGAVGQCCATLGEAEYLASSGITDLLLTAPITEHKITRLVNLASIAHRLSIVVDRSEMIAALQKAFAQQSTSLDVVVDVDVGQCRTGATSSDQVIAIIEAIKESPNLRFKGLQAYAGMLQGVIDFHERLAGAEKVHEKLRGLITFLESEGHPIHYLTGVGTGTSLIDLQAGLFTEIQTGSYIFMDAQYGAVELDGDHALSFPPALRLWTRIISSNHRGFATTDAGLKSIPNDGINPPQILAGAISGTCYGYSGDEFGRLSFPDKTHQAKTGTLIETTVPHCDTTIAAANVLLGIRGDTLEQIFHVGARGAW